MLKKYILGSILINFNILTIILFVLGIYTIKLLSLSNLILLSLLLIAINIFIIYCYLNKTQALYNTGILISILSIIILSYYIYDLNDKYSYIKNIYTNQYSYQTYNIYVKKKNTMYSNVSKLSGKKIGMLKSNSQFIQDYLNNFSNLDYLTYDDCDELISSFLNSEVQSIILSEEDYDKIEDNKTNIKGKIRVIYSNRIKSMS